jgi:ATP-dependent helicase/nuclease subunit B
MCRATYDFLCTLSVSEQLKAEALERLGANERREAEELSRLYGVTVDTLDAVAATLGDEALDIAQFSEALSLVFARTDIGTIPTSADEVTVGSASMLRADHPKFVLVLGLCEGEFPRNVGDDGLISDTEKERLAELGLELPSGRAERASDELFYVYRAFSSPREHLYLSYSKSQANGQAASPSMAISRVNALLPRLPLTDFAALPLTARIYSPDAALDILAELPDNLRVLLSFTLDRLQLSTLNLNTPIFNQEDTSISKDLAAEIFGKASFSPSHLESFASCRFAYYCSRILRLREEGSSTLELSDTGIFIHHVLEHVMRRVARENRPFSSFDAEEIRTLVAQICSSYQEQLEQSAGEMTPRAKALMGRLETLARLIVIGIFEEFSDSLFRPVFTELDLRRIGESPDVTL